MIKKISILVMFMIMAVSVIFNACAKKSDVIRIATDATWPPMESVDEKTKQIVGFDIDFLNAVAKEGNLKIEIVNTAWDGIFVGLDAGKYDAICSSVTITEKRKETMDFTDPYISIGQIIIVKKDVKNMDSLDKFEGKKVGAQIGTTGAFEIAKNKNITLKTYDEIGFAIEDLVNGRIDAVVCDTPTALNYVLFNPKYKDTLKTAGSSFTKEQYGIAVKKGNKRIISLLNAGIAKVKEKGIDKELEKKWLK